MAATHIKPDPDHVPHDVVGILALSVVAIALLTGMAWLVFGAGAAIVMLAIVGLWWIARLTRRAERERVEEALHPPEREEPVDPHDRSIS